MKHFLTILLCLGLPSFYVRCQSDSTTQPSENIHTFEDIRWWIDTHWSEESLKTMDTLASIIQSNTSKKLEVGHHMDVRGTAERNMEFSQQKIKYIKELLRERGVNVEKIAFKAYGESKPIFPQSEIDKYRTIDKVKFLKLHALNNRIELIIKD